MNENVGKFTTSARPWFKWGMVLCVILLIGIYVAVQYVGPSNGLNKIIVIFAGMFAFGVIFHLTLGVSFTAGMYGVGGVPYAIMAGAAYAGIGYKAVNAAISFLSAFAVDRGVDVVGRAAPAVVVTAIAQLPIVSSMVGDMYGSN